MYKSLEDSREDDLAQLTVYCGISTKRTGRQAVPAGLRMSSDSVVLPYASMISSSCDSQAGRNEKDGEESKTEIAIALRVSRRSASVAGRTGKAMSRLSQTPISEFGTKIHEDVN